MIYEQTIELQELPSNTLPVRANACVICLLCFTCNKVYDNQCRCGPQKPRRGKCIPTPGVDSRSVKLNRMNAVEKMHATRWLLREAHPRYMRGTNTSASLETVSEVPLCKKHSSTFYRVQKKWKVAGTSNPCWVDSQDTPSSVSQSINQPRHTTKYKDSPDTKRSWKLPPLLQSIYSTETPTTKLSPRPGYMETVLENTKEKEHTLYSCLVMDSTEARMTASHPFHWQTNVACMGRSGGTLVSPAAHPLTLQKRRFSDQPMRYKEPLYRSSVLPLPHIRSLVAPSSCSLEVQTVTLRNIPNHPRESSLHLYPIPSANNNTYIGLLVYKLSITRGFTFRDLLKELQGTEARIPSNKRLVFTNEAMDRQYPIDHPIRQVIPAPSSTHINLLLGYHQESTPFPWESMDTELSITNALY
ncbi:hypothetical protein BDF14DRAFT_1379279 [Spinellus fusiger]|nr:hypothetical protein BDF14DRAFT_1379279 [Spinellus fusiger]